MCSMTKGITLLKLQLMRSKLYAGMIPNDTCVLCKHVLQEQKICSVSKRCVEKLTSICS